MAEQGEVEIEIGPDGKVTVRTHGIKGPACMDYADLFARLIGREESREKTAEYYELAQQAGVIEHHVDVKQQRRRG
jgi:hypothetical protein